MNALTKAPAAGMVLRPQSFSELVQFAQMAAKSNMVPPTYKGQPESIMLAIQMGSELGLAPMQSLQNIAVINGRPAVWGDAVLGLCRQSAVCKDIVETVTGEGDRMVATCTAVRVGAEPIVRSFSVEDAQKAGLWNKSGPWQQYPKRMLQMRARGFAVRDAFPDVLRGLITAEEAADIPGSFDRPHALDAFRGPTIEHADAVAPHDPAPKMEPRRPRQTAAQWLDETALELAAAPDADAVNAIMERPKYRQMRDWLKESARDRLQFIEGQAMDRLAAAEETSAPNDGVYADPADDPFLQPVKEGA